jgi:hypothetical protein
MREMDECMKLARHAEAVLSHDEWRALTGLAREIIPERMSLDDLPAVALALERACPFVAAFNALAAGPRH